MEDINKNLLIKSTTTQTVPTKTTTNARDTTDRLTTSERVMPSVIVSNIANPKQYLITLLEQTIATLRRQKVDKENTLINIQPQLAKEIQSKIGFLDELEIMYSLIIRSNIALDLSGFLSVRSGNTGADK